MEIMSECTKFSVSFSEKTAVLTRRPNMSLICWLEWYEMTHFPQIMINAIFIFQETQNIDFWRVHTAPNR